MSDTDHLINRSQSGNHAEGNFDRIWRPILAEMIGVTLFVFVGCCSTVSGNITGAALGHGFMIALLIMGFGEISGGHFNPAVTLGVALSGGLPFFLVPGYMVGQIVGAILGASFIRATFPNNLYRYINGGTHQLGHINLVSGDTPMFADVEPGWAIFIETVLTTVLVLTVLMAAVNSRTKSSLAPLAIGFAVAVDIMAGGMLTGASMNPARAIGPAIVSSAVISNAWTYHYVYWIGPTLGAVLATFVYRFLFASQSMRWIARTESF